ncbi:competence type IV pilus ATPase ComGA [Bacillus andreraoultii]|uniref:competence type IV pilus ATPase ComGA n=1 Tax=Bacillus andreraoultii TaxID=1499685 RepID=UPI00053AF38A|nr:competence type IV pilus ATPase ComGA [Bacillus andreraoultii]
MLSSIEKRAKEIIEHAFSLHATDIHIIPKLKNTSIMFRLSHKLIPMMTIELDETERLISYMKFQAAMDIGEKRRPQNGSFQMNIFGQLVGLRLSTLPSIYSESLVIRLLPQETYIPFRHLSLFPKSTRLLLSMLKFSHGLIILTGPTGSGKTTTLYSLLQHSTKFLGRNVITLEDPVEKSNEELLQVQVNEKAGVTYSAGLKAILRHDPDIIMVGEIRDEETAEIAIRAALTGHLVLTTMHTKDAKGALYRLLEFGINWHEIEQTLVAVTAQRLVELICPYCLEGNCPIYCSHYKSGRTAVYEILYGRALKDSLLEAKGETVSAKYPTLSKLIAKGVALGFLKESEYERWVHEVEATTVET